MVEAKDFGFIQDYLIYDELPYFATGYIKGGCNYTPPYGYTVISCDSVGTKLVGGSNYTDLYMVRVGKVDVVGTQSLMLYGGIALIVLVGIGAFILYRSEHKSKVRYNLEGFDVD